MYDRNVRSGALDNIHYSLFKENIKSCNVKRRRQRKGEKTTIGLISKETTLHVQHIFFVYFFAVALHDCNVIRPETSWLQVLWRNGRTCSSLPLIFFLGGS